MAYGDFINQNNGIPFNQGYTIPQDRQLPGQTQLSPEVAAFMQQYATQRPQMPQNGGFVPPQYQQGQQGQMPPQGMPRLPMPPQGSVQQNNGVNRLGGTVVPSAPQMPQQGGNRFGMFMSQYGGGNGGQPSSSMTPTQQQALAQALQRKRAGMFG